MTTTMFVPTVTAMGSMTFEGIDSLSYELNFLPVENADQFCRGNPVSPEVGATMAEFAAGMMEGDAANVHKGAEALLAVQAQEIDMLGQKSIPAPADDIEPSLWEVVFKTQETMRDAEMVMLTAKGTVSMTAEEVERIVGASIDRNVERGMSAGQATVGLVGTKADEKRFLFPDVNAFREYFSEKDSFRIRDAREDLWGSVLHPSMYNAASLRESMELLAFNSSFNPNEDVRNLARWVIWEGSRMANAESASIHDVYMDRAAGGWSNRTIPAINLRTLTFDTAKTIFERLERDSGTAIFEIAKSEMGYTDQPPAEYVATVLAAAQAAGYKGPVFIQGDHFQVSAKEYAADPKKAIADAKVLIKAAIEAGMYNIDLDTSTLVDLDKRTIKEQQELNYKVAAELTAFIRANEPEGITISIGGEIGEIGLGNSTVEELDAFMEGYTEELATYGENLIGISKMSIQTGSAHGGHVDANGNLASEVNIAFDVIENLDARAREQWGIGGVVQHGASTLPQDLFDKFPLYGAMEVHLATGFQNTVFGSLFFSGFLHNWMNDWLLGQGETKGWRKEGQSQGQYLYKLRKKALGQFKREIAMLPAFMRAGIQMALEPQFAMLFDKLNVKGSASLVQREFGAVPERALPQMGEAETQVAIVDDGNPNAD